MSTKKAAESDLFIMTDILLNKELGKMTSGTTGGTFAVSFPFS